jgi:ribosomal protein S15P/S13E
MFESLKSLWKKDESAVEEYNQQAALLADDIKKLEGKLEEDPRNNDVQKQLMLMYNRALNVFAKSKNHRQDVDSLFLRIDELRNIIRRNI